MIGLGQFGNEMARLLAKHAEVLALDKDPARVAEIGDVVQQAICLDVKDPQSLAEVVDDSFDIVIVSLGESMLASILCTLHMKRLGIPRIIAKATNDDHATVLQQVGATRIVFPERETAQREALRLLNPNLLEYVPLAEDYRVMDVTPPKEFYGKTLIELDLRGRYEVFVMAVRRQEQPRFLLLPSSTYKVAPSDVLVMIGREAKLLALQRSNPEMVAPIG